MKPHIVNSSILKDMLLQTVAASSIGDTPNSKRLKAAIGRAWYQVTRRTGNDVSVIYEGDDIKEAVRSYNELG